MNQIEKTLARVASCGGASVTVCAAVKRQSYELIQECVEVARRLGVNLVLGESYLQELESRPTEMKELAERHFIGVLQSNKIKRIVDACEVIQSVGSEKHLALIDKAASESHEVCRVYLQVNISGDLAKSGFTPEQLKELFASIAAGERELPGIKLEGLMTITALYDEPEQARSDFRATRELTEELWEILKRGQGKVVHSLAPAVSMGMSADYEVAIEEGATMVRLGTVLLGARPS